MNSQARSEELDLRRRRIRTAILAIPHLLVTSMVLSFFLLGETAFEFGFLVIPATAASAIVASILYLAHLPRSIVWLIEVAGHIILVFGLNCVLLFLNAVAIYSICSVLMGYWPLSL